jgi:hypothetical protein
MSGRGNNNRGGGNRHQGKGRGNGPKPKITGGSNKKGAKEELGNHVFTAYGTHNAADQMRQSWKYITTYVGNAYSGDMMTEASCTIARPTSFLYRNTPMPSKPRIKRQS